MKTAAIYCRVSTREQSDNGTSLITQEAACLAYAERQGYAVSPQFIFSEDETGTVIDRKELTRLRELVRRGAVEAVIFYHVDRLARNLLVALTLWEEWVERQRIALECVQFHIEPNAYGKFIFQMYGSGSELEAAQIKERTQRGRRRRAEEGSALGAPQGVYGYRRVQVGKLFTYEVVEAEAAIVRKCYDWLLRDGLSMGKIARKLNEAQVPTPRGGRLWRPSTVGKMVRNEAYKGTYVNYKYQATLPAKPYKPVGERRHTKSTMLRRANPDERVPVEIPAIIYPEIWEMGQAALAQNAAFSSRNEQNLYLLSKRVKCGQCNYSYSSSGAGRNRALYYKCPGGSSAHNLPHERCRNKQYMASKLDRLVWDGLVKHMSSADLLIAAMPSQDLHDAASRLELDRLAAEVERLEAGMRRAYEAYKKGVVELDEFVRDQAADKEKLATSRLRRVELEQSLAADRGVVAVFPDQTVRMDPASGQVFEVLSPGEEMDALGAALAWCLVEMSNREPGFEQKRRWLDWLRVRVTVDGDDITVRCAATTFCLRYMKEDLENDGIICDHMRE